MNLEFTSTTDAAEAYIKQGYAVVPIPRGEKGPVERGWLDLRITLDEVDEYFDEDSNIGIINGEASGGLVTVDLDCPEAVKAAEILLPETGMVGGREGNPRSHHWYLCPGMKTKRLKAYELGTICEILSDGTQTVVAPSLHPDNVIYDFYKLGSIVSIDPVQLQVYVGYVAAAALVAHHWIEGQRQDIALHLCGMLARSHLSEDDAEPIIDAICHAAGDTELDQRLSALHTSYEKHRNDEPVTGFPQFAEAIGEQHAKKVAEWLGLSVTSSPSGQSTASGSELSCTSLVAKLEKMNAEFFKDREGHPYMTIDTGKGIETVRINAREMEHLLRELYFEQNKRVAGKNTISNTIAQLEAMAARSGVLRDVHSRIGRAGDVLYVDLGSKQSRFVHVSQGGWKVSDHCGIVFLHTANKQSLPLPESGGSIADLKRFVNIGQNDWPLAVGWLMGALHPTGPYPLLILNGEQGSLKSTTSRILKALIDPDTTMLRTKPRKDQDVMIAARSSWVMAYDNLSSIPDWLSDILCSISTSGAYTCRKLHTDADESVLYAKRPVILNGIPDLANKPDLLDRAIVLQLDAIPDSQRISEDELWADFEVARPKILGALLDSVSACLRGYKDVDLDDLPRMADFAKWVVAGELAAGLNPGEFIAAYQRNRLGATASAIEGSELARLVRHAFKCQDEPWEGSATKLRSFLLKCLACTSPPDWFPSDARALSNELRQIAPLLRRFRIDARQSDTKSNGYKKWQIRRIDGSGDAK